MNNQAINYSLKGMLHAFSPFPDELENPSKMAVINQFAGATPDPHSLELYEKTCPGSLAEFDAEARFRNRAKKGSVKRGLALLGKLDKNFES